ncbi:MAG: magnesium transporter CorA family protein, partial [Acidimicrobiia bacterium]
IEEAVMHPRGGRYDVYEECLHAALTAPHFIEGRLCVAHVDLVIAERFIVTLHRAPVEFLDQVRQNYHQFFATFAESLGFLLFELWDRLIESYRKALVTLEDEVELIQNSILGDLDDTIFHRVSEVTQDLLKVRKNVLADRAVLQELALRRSKFVNPSTQPYLSNMVGTLEQLGNDLSTEREILAGALNLYLSMVSHRTNRIVNRLTLLSAIFLPLTFLCGVYGMNFRVLPEIEWQYGYLFFWVLVAVITGSLLLVLKIKHWL